MAKLQVVVLTILSLAALGACARRSAGAPTFVVNRWYDMPGYSETPFEECNGVDGSILKVEVDPCELDEDACILKSGTNSTIRIQFKSKVDSARLKAVVHGIVGGIPIPFHIPQGNACENSGVSCPVTNGQTYDYSTQIPVLKTYPRLSVKVKWELVDSNNKNIVCVVIPAKIRSA